MGAKCLLSVGVYIVPIAPPEINNVSDDMNPRYLREQCIIYNNTNQSQNYTCNTLFMQCNTLRHSNKNTLK